MSERGSLPDIVVTVTADASRFTEIAWAQWFGGIMIADWADAAKRLDEATRHAAENMKKLVEAWGRDAKDPPDPKAEGI